MGKKDDFYFEKMENLFNELGKVIIGQKEIIKKIFISFLSNGHVLLEGVPGLAKTQILKSFARLINCSFKRIQFTPDLLPSDIIGTMIYNPRTMQFNPSMGPIFNNIILADEINRAPSKVQSALLQGMAEYEVNLGGINYKLPEPFYVLATQNPIEQEGTYPLPEAQLDRFMFKLLISYPSEEEEMKILNIIDNYNNIELNPIISVEDLKIFKEKVNSVYIDDKLKKYIAEIVFSTRFPDNYNLSHISNYIQWGASPRATIFIYQSSKTTAFINGRNYVLPEDIKFVVNDVLRHRIILSYEAIADNISTDYIIDEILQNRLVP